MTSLVTNIGALRSLRAVNDLNNQLADSANRIALGRRVTSAADNPAIWSVAARMQSDNATGSTVADTLTVTKGILDAAKVGLDTAASGLSDLRDLLVSARSIGVDRGALQDEIAGIQASLRAAATESGIGGVGLLDQPASASYNPVKSFITAVTTTAAGTEVATASIDVRGVALTNANADKGILDKTRVSGTVSTTVLTLDISALTDGAADLAKIDAMVAIVDAAMAETTDATATVSLTSSRIAGQQDFLDSIEAIKTAAISNLIDANLEEEAAIKDALVVRQQLAIEALAIANSSLSSILRLFE